MFSALFGYALGTLQILLPDWLRARNAHAVTSDYCAQI